MTVLHDSDVIAGAIKLEQAPKVKLWMPTRLLTGEGRANKEETDKHLFGPPGYWARHAGKMI